MKTRSHNSHGSVKKPRRVEKKVVEWEKAYPDAWILLEVTEEDDGEPVRGKLIATARDPEELQKAWKSHRTKGLLTMLTYGPPLKPGPAVVVSAA
jgi:hypothetical protein